MKTFVTIDVICFVMFVIAFVISCYAKDEEFRLRLTEFQILLIEVFVVSIAITLVLFLFRILFQQCY